MLRTSALLSCALILAGLVVGLLIRQDANAQDQTPRTELTCKHFEVEPGRDGGVINTGDATTEIGQWARSKEAEGWRVATADFEMGVKSNGFPIAYTQVCLSRAR